MVLDGHDKTDKAGAYSAAFSPDGKRHPSGRGRLAEVSRCVKS
jgi:hypothetical protein